MAKPPNRPRANTIPYILFGLVVVLTMFGGLGTWASLAHLDGAVIAPGVVTVYSQRKSVQHLEGGIVDEILIKEGGQVERGALLIRLDDTSSKANLAIVDGQLNVLRAREARLRAELTNRAELTFPDLLAAKKDDEKIAAILAGEEELFQARKTVIEGQTGILTQRIAQLKDEIGGLAAQRKAKDRQIILIKEEVEGLVQLYLKGYAPKTRILALERNAEHLKGGRGEHIADIARAKASIGETEMQILQITHNTQQEVAQEIREVQAEIFDLEERRVAAADALRRTEIRAPQSGTVVGLDVHTRGGVIASGQTILEIVPEEDELVIEARLAPHDIDKVTSGQEAAVRFSAFNLRTTPDVIGTVFMASADRMVDPASGQPYYLLRVRVSERERAKLKDLELMPGMPAEVFANTGERTPLSYLLKPLTDALARTFRED